MTISVALLGPLLATELTLVGFVSSVNAQVILETAESAELFLAAWASASPDLVHSTSLHVQLVPH